MTRLPHSAAAWLLAVTVLACSSASEDAGPSATLEEFYGHLDEADYASAMALYSTDAAELWDDAAARGGADFASWALLETRHGQVDGVRVLRQSIDGTAARLDYEVAYSDGTTVARSARLVLEDGRWRMGPIG